MNRIGARIPAAEVNGENEALEMQTDAARARQVVSRPFAGMSAQSTGLFALPKVPGTSSTCLPGTESERATKPRLYQVYLERRLRITGYYDLMAPTNSMLLSNWLVNVLSLSCLISFKLISTIRLLL